MFEAGCLATVLVLYTAGYENGQENEKKEDKHGKNRARFG
jgi:hypothetical protein